MNIRIDDIHSELLENMVEKLEKNGVKTNKTDIIQKAIYAFAYETVLGKEVVSEIVDKHYKF